MHEPMKSRLVRVVALELDKEMYRASSRGMTSPTTQRQVRFPRAIDDEIQRRAEVAGLSVPAWMKKVIHQSLDNADQDALLEELRSMRSDQREQLDRMNSEIKAFVVEALMGLGERLTGSQQAFLRELVAQLPQSPTGPRHDELFPVHGARK